jgi:hypothetical protein
MATLAQKIKTSTPVSLLLHKARRLGIHSVQDMIGLSITRGCTHYRDAASLPSNPIPRSLLGDDELTILLLVGANEYSPAAVRCAAQLARSTEIRPARLARLARMEKTERVLSHIARAGLTHDPDGQSFWREFLALLPNSPDQPEPHLPHWNRFVSMAGIQRNGPVEPKWLVPSR